MIELFAATKAFIIHNNKILILKESTIYEDSSNAGRYDVVGGRIKPGQHFKESLMREIKEETGLNVRIGKPFFMNEWRPIVNNQQWHIVATFLECHSNTDQVQLSRDHDHHQCINPEEFKNYNIIENLHPAFEAFIEK